MARHVRTYVETTDDLSGEIIQDGHGATFRFGWMSDLYEIDANDENAAAIRAMFGRLTDAGRKIGKMRQELPGQKKAKAIPAQMPKELPASPEGMSPWRYDKWAREMFGEIREWARSNGFPDHPDKGALRSGVREAWNAAHPDRPAPGPEATRRYKERKQDA